LLYRLAQRFRSGETQGVAEWLRSFQQINAEDFWSLVWYEPDIKVVSIQQQKKWQYFPDHEVFYWRSDWTSNATAFAFKCGPSEGHHTASQLLRFPDWRLSSGHAHPDANSFIIFARGQYLTGDTGYAGIPLTAHHNTVLFDHQGQAKEGNGHDAFDGVAYERLDRIRIFDLKVDDDRVLLRGDATSAYEPKLGVKQFIRQFEYSGSEGFTIRDEIQTEKPAVITSLLHVDDRATKEGDGRFSTRMNDVELLIESKTPETQAVIEPNILTAAGPPGAVDKGERQQRGERLAISTNRAVTNATFVLKLRILPVNTSTR
jgi:hypothetical protein